MRFIKLLSLLPITLLAACSNYIGTFYNVNLIEKNDDFYKVKVGENDYLVYSYNVKYDSWENAPKVEGYDYIASKLKAYTDNRKNRLWYYID